ncbi:reverse transcriptase domain-containing protein [Tanacetum coccineum]|uniref:Reverse transcriptase domain-containing protein n=1 Tax=Tanacetum coccineum TaxID=301880 RepID=A0ABQ5J1K7_9ASTR
MDLCGPMRVESINGKKYVLVIVDDYSRYTWTHLLRSKDETPGVLIDFLTLVQRGLHAQVTTVRTDKGTEFLNKTLHAYFAKEGIRHETSTARTPEQNGVVERRNRTLVEAARTMLSAAKVPLFFWAEAIATVKVAYDRYALWVTHVKVMRKHGYGYLEEIVVRRADNILYRFKEGDFPRLRINDIEDMLILVVQNRLTNLSGDDVADFAIALRMFTRSLPDTTRPDLRKRHPYTPYKDPQGFIYVDDYKRNRLMRSDELYKFSDGTLTRLLSLLEDITKNIDMEYLPKRRWSTLEKKRAHFMIKDINKLLKERRMMRSLEKFVGGRLYGTDLRLLQRTI